MNDDQVQSELPKGGIPVISPVLHYLAMPVILLLRCNFGYSFLSPKSVFLSTIFLIGVISYIVWHEPALKSRYWPLCLFFLAGSALYLLNLAFSVQQEVGKSAEHDKYSGFSFLLLPLPEGLRSKAEGFVQIVIEPSLVVVLGKLLAPKPLGSFLVVSGSALAFKGLINAWLGIRRRKRFKDSIVDAEASVSHPAIASSGSILSQGRTESERFQRVYDKSDQD